MSKFIKRFIVIFLLLLGLIFVGYQFVPAPGIEGADLADTTYKVSFNAPITVHFEQKMNKKSVQKAFQIYPSLEGQMKWASGSVLEYYPSFPMAIGDKYKVVIRESARNIYGKSFGIDYTLPFEVTGQPFVQFVSPQFNDQLRMTNDELKDGSVETQDFVSKKDGDVVIQPKIPTVSQNQAITVMFDRPMQLEKMMGEKRDLLIIEPGVEGNYELIGTNAFRFNPKEWPMGTRFKLKVPSGILSRDGGVSEEEKVWTIQTPAPKVTEITPHGDQEDVGINTSIIVKFNQKVDLNQIRPGDNVLLYPSNDIDADRIQKNDGFFNTEVTYKKDEEGNTNETVLIFKPTFSYQYDKKYRLVIKSGLTAPTKQEDKYGTLPMSEDFELVFTTQKKPGAKLVHPKTKVQKESFIEIEFSSPMSEDGIRNGVSIEPNLKTDPIIELEDSGKKAVITYEFDPSTEYEFTLSADTKDRNGDLLGKEVRVDFRTADLPPSLKFKDPSPWKFVLHGVDPSLNIDAVNVDSLNIQLCSVSASQFFKFNKDGNWNDYDCINPSGYRYAINSEVNRELKTNINLASIFNTDWKEGIYHVSVAHGRQKISKNFLVSDMAIVLKKSEKKAVAWAMNLKTNQPEENLEIAFYNHDGQKINIGKTDSNGIYEADIELGEGAYVVGKNQENWVFASDQWRSDEGDIGGKWISHNEPQVYFLTDKNIYSSGEKMIFKGWYRIADGSGLKMPKQKKINILIKSGDDESIIEEKVPLRRNGSFDGEVEIPKLTKPGQYNVVVVVNNNDTDYVFNSSIEIKNNTSQLDIFFLNAKNHYSGNDPINFDIEIKKKFGIPVPEAVANWNLFQVLDDGSMGEKLIVEGEMVFDKKGKASLLLDSDRSRLFPGNLYRLQVVLGAHKVSREFIVHKGRYDIEISTKNRIVKPKEEILVDVFARFTLGSLVGDKKISLGIYHRPLDGGKEDGEALEDQIIELKEGKGQASFLLPEDISGGAYVLRAEGEDDLGNKIISKLDFFVESDLTEIGASEEELFIFADRDEYFVGGKARLLIVAPQASKENKIKTLVVYGGTEILSSKFIELTSKITPLYVEIDEKMIANFYVDIVAISTSLTDFDKYLEKQNTIRNKEKIKQLEVQILLLSGDIDALKEEEVIDQKQLDVLKENFDQKEAEKAELELLVVSSQEGADEGELKSKMSQKTINLKVNKRGREIKIDLISTPINPRPGESVSLKIRTYDYQNRPIPSIVTLKVSEKDEGIVGVKKWSLLDYFYPKKALQIISASSLTMFNLDYVDMERSNTFTLPNKGFVKEVAYFNSLITTDDGGYAEVNFALPSDHASWEIEAIATSDQVNLGTAHLSLTATKPLAIQSLAPSFLVSGDELKLEVKVVNQSDRDLETKIELRTDALKIKSGTKKNLFIKAGESMVVGWDVEVLNVDRDKLSKIAYRAKEGYLESHIQIKSFISAETVLDSGLIDEDQNENWEKIFRIPKTVIEKAGGLNVSMGANLNIFINENVKIINNHPYPSNELRASSLIAELILGKKDDFINKMIFDIETAQLLDGSYPVWKEEEGDVLLTAYVLYALTQAEQGKYSVDLNRKKLAIEFLWKKTGAGELSDVDLSFVLWSLSEAGQYDTGSVVALLNNREELPVSSKAFLLMASKNLLNAGQKSIYPFITRLQSEIVTEKISDGENSYFEEKEEGSVNEMTTALALMALNRVSSDNPVNPQVLKYLISSATHVDRWTNLQELVWKSIAFSEVSKSYIPLEGELEMIISAALNNQIIIDEPVEGEALKNIYSEYIPLKTLKKNDELNTLSISKIGMGEVYYTSQIRYFLENKDVTSKAKGVLIEHSYADLSGDSVDVLKKGDVYLGKLMIIAPKNLDYVVLEELLPAGIMPIAIKSDMESFMSKYQIEEGAGLAGINWIDNPLWNFTDHEIQSDRLLFYAKHLPSGVYNIEYEFQAVVPGEYNLLPASIYEMHNSSVYARTAGKKVLIKE